MQNFKKLSLIVLLLNSFLISNAHAGLSAIRAKDQKYVRGFYSYSFNAYPESESVAYKRFQASNVQEFSANLKLNEVFAHLRDDRFIDADPFLRRPSFLLPDDGCFARAEMMNLRSQNLYGKTFQKIFVFGDLWVETQNSPSGGVGWWYHVAPVTKVNGVIFVLDPSIDPKAPIELSKWLIKMSDSKNYKELQVSVCDDKAYTPTELCFDDTSGAHDLGPSEQMEFLNQEWIRLLDLNRNPESELKDSPPWKLN